MSAALKRRFSFETVFPIADYDEEIALVRGEVERLLAQDGIVAKPSDDVLEVLVTTFRELRTGLDKDGNAGERLSTVVSTAEAVSVAHAVTLRGHYLRRSVVAFVIFRIVDALPPPLRRGTRIFGESYKLLRGSSYRLCISAA